MCYTAQLETNGIFPYGLETFATWDKVQPFPHFLQQSAAARPVVPVVTSARRDSFQTMRWLMVPPWVTTSDKFPSLKIWTANARIEELRAKPLYAPLVEANRCVVLFTGFYEWRHEENGNKTKYRILLADNEPMLLPGLYRTGIIDDEPYTSCTVCTMEARGVMRYVHNSTLRQPVVLQVKDADLWLDAAVSFETARKRTLEAEASERFVPDPPL